MSEELVDIRTQRIEKINKLKAKGINPYPLRFAKENEIAKILADFNEEKPQNVSIAGRIKSKREMGKATFCNIEDMSGNIQLYVAADKLGESEYEDFKSFDLGDIVGVKGETFRTKRGEISIKTESMVLLSKCLRPLPVVKEKDGKIFDEFADKETKYRQRYIDLIVNHKTKEDFIMRSRIVSGVRKILEEKGFLEVETPMMHPIAGGAAARPFITHHNALDMTLYLRIAPELYLKRLVVGGFEKVFEMNRNFRNEGIDTRHNPEFTMLELYQAYADYNDMMEITENLIAYCAEKVLGTTKINYQGTELDLTPPWNRMTMVEAVKKYSGVDFNEIKSDEEAREVAKKLKVLDELKKKLKDCTKGDILNAVFEAYVEEHLIQPTFILDYPVEISPLTKKKNDDPTMTERFEAFIFAREIANAYSELNDPIDQKERFEQQANDKELGDEEAYATDDDFVNSLEIGMPPTGGLGIGVDRIIMFLTDSYSIRDIILFPTMKPIAKD